MTFLNLSYDSHILFCSLTTFGLRRGPLNIQLTESSVRVPGLVRIGLKTCVHGILVFHVLQVFAIF